MFILKGPSQLKLRWHNDIANNTVCCNKTEIVKIIIYIHSNEIHNVAALIVY